MADKIFLFFQYVLPKTTISRLLGWLASLNGGYFTHKVIEAFVKRYGVDLAEAKKENIKQYKTFNSFFTRELKEGSRPLADTDLICPVDGRISQLGTIKQGSLIQAKGKSYTVAELLALDALPEETAALLSAQAADFATGSFATLYLSPKDYHRIHMPIKAQLQSMVHIPGALYSVNPLTANNIDRLFARNERVVCNFYAPEVGYFAMVLVGATVVGSIKTHWHGVVNTSRGKQIRYWFYDRQPIVLDKGAEMGQFLLGSTVILLFGANTTEFEPDWQPNKEIKMGEAMGQFVRL